MLFYVTISLFLWVLATVSSVEESQTNFMSYCCAVCFVLVAGLRFQVGYDWPVYERVFDNTNELWMAISIWDISPEGSSAPKMDFLFELLNSVVKTAGLSFQFLLFVIAFVNAFVILHVCKRFSLNPSICFALYFGLAYLGAQMIVIRTALASSFILLALISRIESKQGRAAFFALIAMGIHFSTIMFLPFLLSPKRRFSFIWVLLLLIPWLFFKDSVDVFMLLFEAFNGASDSFAIEKLSYYGEGTAAYVDSVSFGTLMYISINLIMLWIIHEQIETASNNTQEFLVNVTAFNLTVFILIALVGFYQLPSLWNRIQPVALVMQSIVLANLVSKSKLQVRMIAIFALCIVSTVTLTYQLSKESASEFIPYKTVASFLF